MKFAIGLLALLGILIALSIGGDFATAQRNWVPKVVKLFKETHNGPTEAILRNESKGQYAMTGFARSTTKVVHLIWALPAATTTIPVIVACGRMEHSSSRKAPVQGYRSKRTREISN